MKVDIIFSEKMRFEEDKFDGYFLMLDNDDELNAEKKSFPKIAEKIISKRDHLINNFFNKKSFDSCYDLLKAPWGSGEPYSLYYTKVFLSSMITTYLQANICALDLLKYEDAISSYDFCIYMYEELHYPIFPLIKFLYNNRGNAYYLSSKYESAISDFTKAVALDDNYSNAYFGRGYAYAQLEQYAEAIADFDKCIEQNPNDYEALNNRGAARYLSGNLIGAKDDFSLAIARSGDSYANAFFNLAQAHNRLFEIKEAIQNFDQAIDLEPSNDIFYFGRGLFHLDEKHSNDEQAYIDFETALQLNSEKKNTYIIKRNEAKLKLGNKEPPTVKIIPTDKDAQIRLLREDVQVLQNTIENLQKEDKNDGPDKTNPQQEKQDLEKLKDDFEKFKATFKNKPSTSGIPSSGIHDDGTMGGCDSFFDDSPPIPRWLQSKLNEIDAFISDENFEAALKVAKEATVLDYDHPAIKERLEIAMSHRKLSQEAQDQVHHEILLHHLEIEYLPPRLYAWMSNQTYSDEPAMPDEDYISDESWKTETSLNHGISKSGYFGVAYINHKRGMVIIAHRGTEFTSSSDLYSDLRMFLSEHSNKPMEQANLALDFSAEISRTYDGYRIEHTGHSLGAALAEICACLEENTAITFESPGTQSFIKNRLLSDPHYKRNNINLEACRVTTYLAGPNPINTMGQHLGKVIRVFPWQNEITSTEQLRRDLLTDIKHLDIGSIIAGKYLMGYILHQHGIENTLALFNPVTGELKENTRQELVLSWPKGIDNFIRYFALMTEKRAEFHSNQFNSNAILRLFTEAEIDQIKNPGEIGYETSPYVQNRLALDALSPKVRDYLKSYYTSPDQAPQWPGKQKISPLILQGITLEGEELVINNGLNADELKLYFETFGSPRTVIYRPMPSHRTSSDASQISPLLYFGVMNALLLKPLNNGMRLVYELLENFNNEQVESFESTNSYHRQLLSTETFSDLITNASMLSHQSTNHTGEEDIQFDYGAWDEGNTYHPETGAPIFTYRAFKDNQALGQADFYQHRILCRSEDGTRHNIIKVTGVFEKLDIESQLKTVEDICAALPPTVIEQITKTAKRSAQHGAIRGTASVVEYGLEKTGYSKEFARKAYYGLYYGLIFTMSYLERYSQTDETLPEHQRVMSAAYQAIYDTLTLVFMQIILKEACATANDIGNFADRKGWSQTGRFFNAVGLYGGYGIYAKETLERGPVHAITSLASGIATEKAIEVMGKKVVDRLVVDPEVTMQKKMC